MKYWMMLAVVLTANAEPLTIVENGQPRAAIVVTANEPKADRAALAIQKYVEPVSMPVRISVGRTAAGYDPAIRPEAFEEEEYVRKTQDKTICSC